MSEHPRKTIVLASVLKPVDDTRMYEKFGQSLGQTNKYEINIIGFYSKKTPVEKNIYFHPLFNFKRLSPRRLLAPVSFFRRLLKLKPDVLIIHTHELLWPAVIFKIFYRVKLVYDIRENYGLNIIRNKGYAAWFRPILATYVRLKEKLLATFVSHFLLAERSYSEELTFIGEKYTLLLNKYKDLATSEMPTRKGLLVYSGTIAENYGIFETIELSKDLHKLNPGISLRITGFASHAPTLKKVRSMIYGHDFIELIGGDQLVPHAELLSLVSEAEFAFVPHRLDPSIVHCFPTKIYEYLAFQKPMIMRDHKPWVEYANKYHAAIPTNFEEDASEILHKMQSGNFYPNGVDEDIYWEGDVLVSTIGSL